MKLFFAIRMSSFVGCLFFSHSICNAIYFASAMSVEWRLFAMELSENSLCWILGLMRVREVWLSDNMWQVGVNSCYLGKMCLLSTRRVARKPSKDPFVLPLCWDPSYVMFIYVYWFWGSNANVCEGEGMSSTLENSFVFVNVKATKHIVVGISINPM